MKAAVLIFVVFFSGAAQADVTMRIAAEPEALLPGLTPSLRIWITNDGSVPAEVPTRMALQVAPPRGEPFVAYSMPRGDDRTMDVGSKPTITLAPGETRDVTMWSGDGWFSADERFRTTGVFRLQAVADRNLDSLQLAGLSRILDQEGLARPVVSNETTFTVLEPNGDDRAVWNVMKQQHTTCSAELTDLIWNQYPNSHYAGYCIRNANAHDEMKEIAGLEASLARDPHPYWADGLRLSIAQSWLSRAFRLSSKDVEAAVEAYERAGSILQPLAKNAVSPEHRSEATKLLDSVKTRQEVAEHYQASHGYDARPVRFQVSCFENLPDGARKIWFGYNNPNSKPVNVPIGEDNKFTPPPFNRTQPTAFAPGIFNFAFSVITTEPALAWHLQGKTAQFKVPDATQCPKGFDPLDPTTWQMEDN